MSFGIACRDVVSSLAFLTIRASRNHISLVLSRLLKLVVVITCREVVLLLSCLTIPVTCYHISLYSFIRLNTLTTIKQNNILCREHLLL